MIQEVKNMFIEITTKEGQRIHLNVRHIIWFRHEGNSIVINTGREEYSVEETGDSFLQRIKDLYEQWI